MGKLFISRICLNSLNLSVDSVSLLLKSRTNFGVPWSGLSVELRKPPSVILLTTMPRLSSLSTSLPNEESPKYTTSKWLSTKENGRTRASEFLHSPAINSALNYLSAKRTELKKRLVSSLLATEANGRLSVRLKSPLLELSTKTMETLSVQSDIKFTNTSASLLKSKT